MKMLALSFVLAAGALSASVSIAQASTLPVLGLYCMPKVADRTKSSSLNLNVDLNTLKTVSRFDVLSMVTSGGNVLIVDGATATKSAKSLSVVMKNATSSITIEIPNDEIDAMLRGDTYKTSYKVTKASKDIGKLDTSGGCEMASETTYTGDASTDAATAAMITGLKVPNTGAAGTEYPVRRNLDLGNVQIFCVSVEAQTSYHIKWPARSYCAITVRRFLLQDNSTVTRLTGADAATLTAALPQPSLKFTIDHGSDGYDKIHRDEFAIDCATPGLCLITQK